jgi:hypothetical protein
MGAVSFPIAGLGQQIHNVTLGRVGGTYVVSEHVVYWVCPLETQSLWPAACWLRMTARISKAVWQR